MFKLNRGVFATSLIFSLSAMPWSSVQAVSDEVAVQLLERLGELEQEISNLRGENEMLRNELTDVRSTQREGFLEVDERVSGLEKKRLLPQAATTANPDNALPQATGAGNSVPALEAPQVTANSANSLPTPGTIVATPTPITVIPEQTAVEVTPGASQTAPQLADENIAAQRQAVAPVTADTGNGINSNNSNNSEKVDPNSPDSYYYYGTQDKNTAGVVAPIEKNPSKASLVEKKQKPLPDTHKAKAAYNQAYKSLVNDPQSAVPAFRAFMQNYPDHELVANAQYWLGEALYAQKDYSGATEEFMQVLKRHKGSSKAPGAALKLGYSFYELRQWDFARRTLEDTVRFFPDTNAAKLAATRLDRMTQEGR